MRRSPLRLSVVYASLVALIIIYTSPFIWMFVQSLKTLAGYFRRPPEFLVADPQWENYTVLLSDPTFIRSAINSLVVATIIATLQVIVSALAGFVFATADFKGKRVVFATIISTLMIPSTATIIPLFMIVQWMGLINTYAGLILPFIFTAFGIFLMRQFFLSLPRELKSAAVIDGASTLQVFTLIYFPLALPGAVTLWVLAFVAYWNSLLWPLIAISSTELSVLPQRIALLLGSNAGQPNVLMAAAAISIVPVLVVFAALQRYYVRGLIMSGFK